MNINKKQVKDLRIDKAWTQEQLAEIMGVSTRTIQRIESKGITSMDTVSALSAVFNVSRESLIIRENETQTKVMNSSLLMLILFVLGIIVGIGTSNVFFTI